MARVTREEALEYHHLKGKPGKIEVVVCVRPDFQRQGVGTAVYDHIMQALEDREVIYLSFA